MQSLPATLSILVLSLSLACSRTPGRDDGTTSSGSATEPLLTFTVEGAGLGTRTFGPDLTDVTGHWVYDASTGQTRIHISGNANDWRAGIDFVVPLSGPGRYQADTSYKGIDRAFAVALDNHRTRKRVALIGAKAEIRLEPNQNTPHLMMGTFSGRFAVGERTTGTDILPRPLEERTYATIRDGRFRLRFRDTLHGKGETWPGDPRS